MGAPAHIVPNMSGSATEIKLFNKWTFDDVSVSEIPLTDYIAANPENACFLPHSAGRWQKKRFKKAQCPIVERLTNSLMMHGRNNGKKVLACRIVKHTLEIIHLVTGENPIQVVTDAVINSVPVRILAASGPLVWSAARPSMSRLSAASIWPSSSSPRALARPLSATSRPLLSALLRRS